METPEAPIKDPMLDRKLIIREAAGKYLNGIEAAFSYQQFERALPRLAEHSPEALRIVHDQIIDFLKKSFLSELETILANRNLPKKLDEVWEMCEDAQRRLQTGQQATVKANVPGSITPRKAIRASVYPRKRAELEVLRARKAELREDNAGLMKVVKERYEKLARIDELSKRAKRVLDERDANIPNASLKSTTELAEVLAFGAPLSV
ncbi:hypothetical protein HDU93_007282 [Gonapodya sp. JEL0774]|nr:hypothetical protein HDU93_007282 [Gonapodya sp. JEL0774]